MKKWCVGAEIIVEADNEEEAEAEAYENSQTEWSILYVEELKE